MRARYCELHARAISQRIPNLLFLHTQCPLNPMSRVARASHRGRRAPVTVPRVKKEKKILIFISRVSLIYAVRLTRYTDNALRQRIPAAISVTLMRGERRYVKSWIHDSASGERDAWMRRRILTRDQSGLVSRLVAFITRHYYLS